MSNKKMIGFIMAVLKLCDRFEIHDSLYWDFEDGDDKISFTITCNDVFWWGCSDCEKITPENIHLLEKSLDDCKKISRITVLYGTDLFVARVRKMRPQGAAYRNNLPDYKKLWLLYDSCGPERELGLGNPYNPGEYKSG